VLEHVRLTRTGSAVVSRVNKLIPALEEEIGQGLSESEAETMVALLLRLARSSAARRHIERSGSPFALQIGGLIAAGAGKL